jgi:hypothetical protein
VPKFLTCFEYLCADVTNVCLRSGPPADGPRIRRSRSALAEYRTPPASIQIVYSYPERTRVPRRPHISLAADQPNLEDNSKKRSACPTARRAFPPTSEPSHMGLQQDRRDFLPRGKFLIEQADKALVKNEVFVVTRQPDIHSDGLYRNALTRQPRFAAPCPAAC